MKIAKRVFLFCLIVSILAITGTIQAEELKVRQPMQSEIGNTVTCPVMGGKFEVTKSTPVIDYKGKSYYLCCDHCVADFRKTNSAKYAK